MLLRTYLSHGFLVFVETAVNLFGVGVDGVERLLDWCLKLRQCDRCSMGIWEANG